MKHLMLMLLAATALIATPGSARADDPLPFLPILVSLPPERVFVPRSFDNNDNAQITITGTFSSTCFRLAQPTVEVLESARTVRVRARAYYYSQGTVCQRMLVPYAQTIDLGVLSAKTYKIEFARETDWVPMSQIRIAESKNSGPDDQLYAHVTEVSVLPIEGSPTKTLTIEGILLNSCMQEPALTIGYHPFDVIEVLPVVDMTVSTECNPTVTPFRKTATLEHRWDGPTLVHVRSLNGQSFNKIVTFAP